MSATKRLSRLSLLVAGIFAGGIALASPKTLIEMEGGKPTAGLAKSWKKVKDGEYLFDLDTSLEVKKGVPVSPDIVKEELESKLGSSNGVKVKKKGDSAVEVSYTGDESDFLDKVAKTKIRAKKNVELALDSSVSEGAIRAKTADRAPVAGEVKIIVIGLGNGTVLGKVNDTKSSKVKNGAVIKVQTGGKKVKVNDKVFFMPERQSAGVWIPKAGSFK